MSTWRPWKLYLALEGEPRQLIDAFATFREAAGAFAEIVGAGEGTLMFKVAVDIRPHTPAAMIARFKYDGKPNPYIIDLVE